MHVSFRSPRRRTSLVRLLACLGSAAALSMMMACGGSSKPAPPPTNNTPNFATTVFIGDSLTAGFQNGSLLDTQQPHGYAALLAAQAKFNIVQPLIAPPGAPAVLELVSLGPPPVIQQTSGTSTGRDDTSVQPTDLAVPGHKLHDLINAAPTAVPTTAEDIITNLVLGFPVGNTNTQLQEAVALKPTTLVVWIGNNDALDADDSGKPSTMTPLAGFTADFTQMMNTLHTQTSATLLVANIPDVTIIPYMTPAAVVLQESSASSGLSTAQLSTILGIQPASATYAGDYVNAHGLGEVKSILDAISKGQTAGPIDDAGVLTAAEVVQVQQQISQYNQVIAQQTAAVGGTLIDVHAFFDNLKSGVTINNYNATTAFLGGLFSLDGEHPTNTGYALLANYFIDAINTAFKTTIPDVDASTVATSDPYFGPNIKPVGSATGITSTAAERTHWLLNAWRTPLAHAR